MRCAWELSLRLSLSLISITHSRRAGFSEFVEFVCRVAVEGMQQENYDVVFPTPFSKVRVCVFVRREWRAAVSRVYVCPVSSEVES
jgi:hypothetical protein